MIPTICDRLTATIVGTPGGEHDQRDGRARRHRRARRQRHDQRARRRRRRVRRRRERRRRPAAAATTGCSASSATTACAAGPGATRSSTAGPPPTRRRAGARPPSRRRRARLPDAVAQRRTTGRATERATASGWGSPMPKTLALLLAVLALAATAAPAAAVLEDEDGLILLDERSYRRGPRRQPRQAPPPRTSTRCRGVLPAVTTANEQHRHGSLVAGQDEGRLRARDAEHVQQRGVRPVRPRPRQGHDHAADRHDRHPHRRSPGVVA